MTTGRRVKRWAAASFALGVLLAGSLAMAQAKRECQPAGALEKIQGQVVKVEPGQSRVTLRTSDGTMHEFQTSPEMLQTLKTGDKIEIRLRELPKC